MKKTLLPLFFSAIFILSLLTGCQTSLEVRSEMSVNPEEAHQSVLANALFPAQVTSPDQATPPVTEPKKLPAAEVKAIALAHASVNAADVRDLEIELEAEKGVTFYEVSFDANGWEYEYKIEAYTGQIIKSERERDD